MSQKKLKILNSDSKQIELQKELNKLQKIYKLKTGPNNRLLIPIDIMGTVYMMCPDTGIKLTVNHYKQLINVKI